MNVVRYVLTAMADEESASSRPSYHYVEGGLLLSIDNLDKPFKTYSQMLDILENRNITIEDRTLAEQILQNHTYYSLVNGYKNNFIVDKESEIYADGTKFESLYALSIIDNSLNSIIFKYILYVERGLKSRISYAVSKSFGVYTVSSDLSCQDRDDYLCTKHYSNRGGSRYNVLRELKELIVKSKNPIIVHYRNDHNHIPPWILTCGMTYGQTIKWYEILKNDEKTAVCNTYMCNVQISLEERKNLIKKCIDLSRQYRNRIAHGGRTFATSSLPELPKNVIKSIHPSLINSEKYDKFGEGKNDTYAVIIAVMLLLSDEYLKETMLDELKATINPYAEVSLNGRTVPNILGLPDDFIDRLSCLL